MKVIKKMIADYDALIKFYEDRMNSHIQKIDDANDIIESLDIALQQVAGIEDAEEVLAVKRDDKQRWLNNHGVRLVEDAKAEYEHVKSARKHFLSIMQQNCEHDMKFSFTDHHKGEDYYTCTICGLSR